MPSAITLYCCKLFYITLYYFILHCTLSLIDTMGPQHLGLQDLCHAIITCNSGAWVGIGHALITCNSEACDIYVTQWFHAIPELAVHVTCPHDMEVRSSYSTYYATTACKSGIYWVYTISSLNAIIELVSHMLCPQLLACNALYCFVNLYITS